MMTLTFPPVALVVLCGTSGCGKSTFAARHFAPTEVISSDHCRAMLLDDPASQAANEDAFTLLHTWLTLRLKQRRFTVVDSTALKPSARATLVEHGRAARVPVYVVAFDVPFDEALRRDASRPERQVGEKVVTRQRAQFEQAAREIAKDKHLAGHWILTPEQMDAAHVTRLTPPTESPAFDIVGDVHGCLSELKTLLATLGYDEAGLHPDGRVLAFVGDLTDRGPNSPGVLRFVCDLVAAGRAVFVPGNHDDKLFRLLQGANVKRTHGLELTEEQLLGMRGDERETLTTDVLTLLASAPPYAVCDGGRLVVAHAGIRDEMIGHQNDRILSFTRYGDVRGFHPDGMPIRHDWAAEREPTDSSPWICYGHTPQSELRVVNKTINLDGGCVFGGFLAALRYPEGTTVTVPAEREYAVPRVAVQTASSDGA